MSSENVRRIGDDPIHFSRRDFVKGCLAAAAAVGLGGKAAAQTLQAATGRDRPPIIWLQAQACGGGSMSLFRASHPDVGGLIFDLASIEYHTAFQDASGSRAQRALADAIERNRGRYLLIVEGAVPTGDAAHFCMIGGRPAAEVIADTAKNAAAVIALGSCAASGGIVGAKHSPTSGTGIHSVSGGKPLLKLPGCPPNPNVLLGTILQFAAYGTLPKLDGTGRPLFAYARTVHEQCPRRPAFDAGHFAGAFGDDAHRRGDCLYKLGCKGPVTHASCPVSAWADVPGAWPVGVGHPCIGCADEKIGFRAAMIDKVRIPRPTPSDAIAPVNLDEGDISPFATGVAGLIGGILAGAAWFAAKKLEPAADPDVPAGTEETQS